MAVEGEESFDEIFENANLPQLGLLYSSTVLKSWNETYSKFEEFVFQFKKEFGRGINRGEAMGLYSEMMEKAGESLGIELEDYDGSGYDVEHVQNAFIYGANEEPDPKEFREAITDVLEEKREWRDYAQRALED